jgi:hypothetical protein
MKRIAIAAVGVFAALAALAQCGGTTGRDSPVTTMPGDATVGDMLDAGLDVYTNQFDVALTYADQELPDVQAPPMNGGGGDGGLGSLGVPYCPPFIFVDGTGTPLPDCNLLAAPGCPNAGLANDAVPADWSDGGEVVAREGGVCATYPWLGSLANDEAMTSNNPSDQGLNLPPCNWAADAGPATQGTGIGQSRYALCIALYQCMLRTKCFLSPTPAGGGFAPTAHDCLCGNLLALHKDGGVLTAQICTEQPGPCWPEEIAALEAPVNNPAAFLVGTTNWVQENGTVGTAGGMLNAQFGAAAPYFPLCAFDAGLDCGP